MKLSENQIKKIDLLLEKYSIKYLDIKYELIDHIASQIEDLMNTKSKSFEEAMPIVIQTWLPVFKSQSSFWIGLIYSFPKVIIHKIELTVKKRSIIFLFFLLLWILPMFFYQKRLNTFLMPMDHSVDFLVIIFSLIICLLIVLVNIKSKPTVSRFLINQSSFVLIFSFLTLLLNEEVIVAKLFYLSSIILQTTFMFRSYLLHREFLKKYKFL